MNNLHHPSELNPFKIYQQAKRISQRTSRAKNPDWYSEPFNIQRQWHIWLDGEELVSSLFDQKANRWIEGPSMSWLNRDDAEEMEISVEGSTEGKGFESTDYEELHGALLEALRSRELGGKVSSLGVVLHVADEFAILDPAREYSSNGDFEEVQNILQDDPKEVLGDSTIEPLLNTWRLIPCWGVKEGRMSMAVQLSRLREIFFSAVRSYGEDNNVAIRVIGTSAPLEALRLAPLYLDWNHSQGRGDIIILMYRNFSALMVLDKNGELVQLRSLTHRAGAEYPAGLGDILLNTQSSVALENPVVTILPMCGDAGTQQLTSELTSFFAQKTPMDIGFSELNQLECVQAIPEHRLEMLLGDVDGLTALSEGNSLMENRTFNALSEGGWATQDFYPVPPEEVEMYPAWQELQLRKWFGVAKAVLLVGAIAMAGWGGMKVIQTIGTEAWQMGDVQPGAVSETMLQLKKEKAQMDYWESIMKKRSDGQLVMQFLLELFPEDSGVLITECDFTLVGLPVRAGTGSGEATHLAYSKEWEIAGFSTPQALPYLSNLGSTGYMTTEFEKFAEKYSSEEYELGTKNRTINVTLQREQKTYPRSGMLPLDQIDKYTASFRLALTQRIGPDDELAVPIKMAK